MFHPPVARIKTTTGVITSANQIKPMALLEHTIKLVGILQRPERQTAAVQLAAMTHHRQGDCFQSQTPNQKGVRGSPVGHRWENLVKRHQLDIEAAEMAVELLEASGDLP